MEEDHKTPARDKVKHLAKPRKRKRASQKPTSHSVNETRVYLGQMFQKWRALKEAKGLRSDAEVALFLLDEMNTPSPTSSSSGASGERIKISQSEVQKLIEQEVHSAVKKNESKLQTLVETIEKCDRRVDFERSIRKLEAQMNIVAKRAEAAFAYMKKSPQDRHIIRIESDDETSGTMSPKDIKSRKCRDKSGRFLQEMERTKNAIKKMRADNEALTAAIANLREEQPPSVLVPYGSAGPKGCVEVVNREPENEHQQENNIGELKQLKSKDQTVKVECLSPGSTSAPKHTDSEEDRLVYPPLPATIFPSVLSMEAASYNIPQTPEVHLALIRDPAGLSVLWKVKEEDPSAPPMDSYSIYMTTEKVKGSGVFPNWKMLGEVRAFDLPMCVMIAKYKPGHKVCVAVVGKDKFGRYGPYSKVVTAAIPD
ncbi:activating transcription factor 7-interacting protein 2 isoform X1 [Lates calcarifer]|uniref:Activating transcription factor 7-interacting protein 2 isoform X1 n=1 Tax=Lates calcarifer TaxID=8187 RepID=A0AAJ7LQS8_LATCA|nr:activating transcription factor 7-interacting protein 2 isoform X1 [Lates calcarifer]XP_018528364.1 activating transcription factor 7-interacting protein 2 isoform X1 [Lates calcarifer]